MIKSLKNIINNFKRYQFLLYELISRDFKVKYKRSVLGILWSLLYPILMMSVMAIVFSQMFKFKVEGINYLVYLMTGIIMYNYFSEATNSAMASVVENFGLLNKVYIPKYIFPLSKCLFVGVNFLLTLIPWVGIIILSHFGLGEYACHINVWYLLLPYVFLCLFIFIIGMGFLLSSVSVFLRDMFYIYGIIIMIWNYVTPIFYSITIIPDNIRFLFEMNPLYQYLNAARTIVVNGTAPSLINILLITLWSVFMLIVGVVTFRKNQDKFIYYI